jgi:hypothetical protein
MLAALMARKDEGVMRKANNEVSAGAMLSVA